VLLTSAHVLSFKSIENSSSVLIDPDTTVLVGQNEAGKTAFLQALHKARSAEKGIAFDVVQDYPRKSLNTYQKKHDESPDTVVQLTYTLQATDIAEINRELGFAVLTSLTFTLIHDYANKFRIMLSIPEQPYLSYRLEGAALTPNTVQEVGKAQTIREAQEVFAKLDLNSEETAFAERLTTDYPPLASPGWKKLLEYHIWRTHLAPKLPKFLYFDDYYLLPGKVNLSSLKRRVDTENLSESDRTVLSLLNVAGVDLDSMLVEGGYEPARAKLEAISNTITDRLFKYWTQNRELVSCQSSITG